MGEYSSITLGIMTLTVLVPDDEGMNVLAEVPRVLPVRYQWGEPVPPDAAKAQVLIPGKHPPGEQLWRTLPNLKLIQLLSAGAEDWVGKVPDGVLLSTCRGAHGGSTAEWVVAALLSMYRKLDVFAAAQREGRWERQTADTLQGKRVLVIGAGDLGRHLRRRLEPFDARCTMVGMTAREGVHGVRELSVLLELHDVVVLMVPLTSRTRGMVDAEFLARMRDGAVLVNVSRGAVVDTDALVAELTTGRLRAALDVTDPEPIPMDDPLVGLDNCLIVPHIASASRATRGKMAAMAAANLLAGVRGEPLPTPVEG